MGVLQLIKRAKGRKPAVVSIERTERVTISFDGADRIEIPKEVWTLFNNSGVRRSIESVIKPLKREGIESLELQKNNKPILVVKKDEAADFDAPNEGPEETVIENPQAILVVLSPSFTKGNKWRVSDGSRSIWVTIADDEFLAAVHSGREAFRKGDILHVSLETRQWFEENELKAEHIIRKVHRHENKLETREFSEGGKPSSI
jgi:hypothetical protein